MAGSQRRRKQKAATRQSCLRGQRPGFAWNPG